MLFSTRFLFFYFPPPPCITEQKFTSSLFVIVIDPYLTPWKKPTNVAEVAECVFILRNKKKIWSWNTIIFLYEQPETADLHVVLHNSSKGERAPAGKRKQGAKSPSTLADSYSNQAVMVSQEEPKCVKDNARGWKT